jgi:hypothetical protein
LNKIRKSAYHCLIPQFRRKDFRFSPLTWCWPQDGNI